MNRNNKTSSITESAMITGILVIIAFLSSFISITMFFYPTPAIILAKRKGIKYAGMSLIAAGIIISILLGATTGLIYFILYTPFSLALAYGVYRDKSANKTLLYGASAYMVSFVVLILLMNAFMGINFVEQLKTSYMESLSMSEKMISEMPAGMNSEGIAKAYETIDSFKEAANFILSNLFPAIIITVSICASYINYLVAQRFSRRFSININKFVRISHFSFPRTFMIAMAVLLLISYLLGALKLNVRVIQLNLFNLVYMAMILQGFAVIKFFLERSRLSRSLKAFVMFMIIYMTLLNNGMILIVVLTGLVDLAVDLRKINKAV